LQSRDFRHHGHGATATAASPATNPGGMPTAGSGPRPSSWPS